MSDAEQGVGKPLPQILVGRQQFDGVGESLGKSVGRMLLVNDQAGAGAGERGGVSALVIVGRLRKRTEHGRSARGGQFRQRRSASPADDQPRTRQHVAADSR